jgi:uncharacterized protein (DUF2164 family)
MMRDQPPLRITDDARKRAIASLQQYVRAELDQDIGDLKASLLLDYVLAEIGPSIYNAAIADAKTFFDERSSDLAALCVRDEFPYWVSQGKKRR